MDQPVIPFDLARMFLGDAPPLFLLEILFRTAFIYLYTLTLLRWIGGRTVAQLSMVEFLLVIALGSAVGDAPFYPEVPLLHAMLVVLTIVLINKGLDRLILHSHHAKRAVDGLPRCVMVDGRVLTDTLRSDQTGVDEFLSQLRIHGIRNLGEVETAYLEPDGRISVFRRERAAPGLPIEPPHEIAPPPAFTGGGAMACCANCGALSDARDVVPDSACPYCGHRRWTAPVGDNRDEVVR